MTRENKRRVTGKRRRKDSRRGDGITFAKIRANTR
jgi:hypothetical protein